MPPGRDPRCSPDLIACIRGGPPPLLSWLHQVQDRGEAETLHTSLGGRPVVGPGDDYDGLRPQFLGQRPFPRTSRHSSRFASSLPHADEPPVRSDRGRMSLASESFGLWTRGRCKLISEGTPSALPVSLRVTRDSLTRGVGHAAEVENPLCCHETDLDRTTIEEIQNASSRRPPRRVAKLRSRVCCGLSLGRTA